MLLSSAFLICSEFQAHGAVPMAVPFVRKCSAVAPTTEHSRADASAGAGTGG